MAGPAKAGTGIWISQSEIAALPMSGTPWKTVASTRYVGTDANVADQDSRHDIQTMGAALYAARTGDATVRARAIAALTDAIGTEGNTRWLAVGRNLGGYVIAADVLDIRSGPIYDWLISFKTRKLPHDNNGTPITLRQAAWASGSNASAQEGFVHAALAAYTSDTVELDWGWTAFRRYLGDRTSPWKITSNSASWQQIPSDPVGIQNKGAVKNGILIDGAISNDMSRGGSLKWPPGYTQYPWVGLEGSVPAAVIYERAGYPVWTMADSALKRAADFLWRCRTASGNISWYDTTRAPEIKHVLNKRYGLSYPEGPNKVGARTVSFTDWTMP
jgi:hypothetical protein